MRTPSPRWVTNQQRPRATFCLPHAAPLRTETEKNNQYIY